MYENYYKRLAKRFSRRELLRVIHSEKEYPQTFVEICKEHLELRESMQRAGEEHMSMKRKENVK